MKLINGTDGTLTWNLINSQWPKTPTQFYDDYFKTYFGFNHTSFPPIIASEDRKSVLIWSKEVYARFHRIDGLIRSGLQKIYEIYQSKLG